jgi:hypothetical protein
MITFGNRWFVAAVCAAVVVGGLARADQGSSEADIEEAFHTYQKGPVEIPGIKPGMVIRKENSEAAEGYIPQEELKYLKQGWFEIKVEQTHDVPLHPNYIEATKKNAGKAKLGSNGELLDYEGGLPFPKIDPGDPQAGLKVAWNYSRHYWGDQLTTGWEWKYINAKGDVTRTVHGTVNTLYYKHRYAVDPPEMSPNPEGYFWADHFWISDPGDLRDWQFLIVRHENDFKEDDTWIYIPQLRRVRRYTTSIRTDSLLGSVYTYDDFHGYNGYVRGFNWKYIGEKVMLVPMGMSATQVKYGFHNGCYPDIPWQPRKVLIVERYAKDPNYPFKSWRMYIDKQTYTMIATEQYDAKGEHWKTCFNIFADPKGHLDVNKTAGAPIWIGIHALDHQTGECTTVNQYNSITNQPVNLDEWSVEFLRGGR